MQVKTEAEAVDFAIADRPQARNNEDVEKRGGAAFSRSEVERLLASKGYKQYHRFRFHPCAQTKMDGWTEMVLSPISQNPRTEDVLRDFIDRAKTDMVDSRFRDFHARTVIPVFEAIKSNLLVLEIRQRQVFSKVFTGQSFGGKALGEDEILRRLKQYAAEYYAPLKLESTSKGEWRFDTAHVSDPENPHAYDHLHVYHKVFPYHTTLRTTSF